MKVRNGKIKKPHFYIPYLVSVLVLLALFFAAGLYLYTSESNKQELEAQEQAIISQQNMLTTIRMLTNKDRLKGEDLSAVQDTLLYQYCQTGQRYRMIIADREEFEDVEEFDMITTSRTAIMTCWDDHGKNHFLRLAAPKYLETFNKPEVTEHQEPVYDSLYTLYPDSTKIYFVCNRFYADLDKGIFIPVDVEIMNYDSEGEPVLSGVKLSFNPDNTEGLTLYEAGSRPLDIYSENCYGYVAGYDGEDRDEDYTQEKSFVTFYFHLVSFTATKLTCSSFADSHRDQINKGLIIIVCAALVFALIPATIIYNVRMRSYQIFEYRRQMIDAMAHDLKTPMAALSAYAENLSNNIATDKKEYYAGKIEDKVAQMNKMVGDILEFSKSENRSTAVTKIEVDVASVISDILADNDHALQERSLKVNYDKKSVVIKTDKKLFEQAISNLISNAVLYSKEGTVIDIGCSPDRLTITNVSAEKLEDVKSLKQAFTKGSLSRGSKGTGLGLAIADNNLAMLKYKLDVRSEGDKFIATVKM